MLKVTVFIYCLELPLQKLQFEFHAILTPFPLKFQIQILNQWKWSKDGFGILK